MRPRLIPILLVGTLLAGGAGALAQAEAERRLDAAIAQLRAALAPEGQLEIGGRRIDPVSGRAALADVAIIRGAGRITIPEVILSDVREGRIGQMELRRISERGGAGTTDIGRLMVTGLAIPAPGTPLTPMAAAFDTAEAESLMVTQPDGKLALARLTIEGWRGDAVGAATLEGLDFAKAGQGQTPGDSLRLRRLTLAEVVLPLAGNAPDPAGFRAGRIALEGVEGRQGAENLSFGLGRIELRDWLPGRPTALLMEDLRADGPTPELGQLAFRLGRVELSGVDGAGTLAAILGNRQVPDPFEGMPQRLSFEGLRAEAEGQPLLALARLLSESRLERGMISGRLATEGFRLTLPRGQAAWLQALGYREIAGGIELAGEAPRAGGRLGIDPLRISWDQAATLTLTGWLDGMPAAPDAGAPIDQDATLAEWAAMRLGALTLTLRDHGLLGRIMAQQAREQRIPEARLREQWAQMALAMPLPGAAPPARRGAGPPPGPDPLLSFRTALAAFIRQPGTLEIALRPTQPLTFEELGQMAGDPADGLHRLGLTAQAR